MFKNLSQICRVCLNYGNLPLFDSFQHNIILMQIADVKIFPNDGYPSVICAPCAEILKSISEFRNKVQETDLELRRSKSTEKIENFSESIIQNSSIPVKNEAVASNTQLYNITIISNSEENTCKTNQNLVLEYSKEIKSQIDDKELSNTDSHIRRSNRQKNVLTETDDSTVLNTNLKNIKDSSYKIKRNQTRKHMCHTCGKTFIYQSNLNDHARIHSGSKPFICSICGRGFAQTGHLLVHTRSHSGDKPYKCEICQRSFSIRQALKKHSRTHTGERPYACNACSKTFVTSYHLSNHFKRHTGEKNFKCDFVGCTLSFVNISEMKRHRIRHDKQQTQHKHYVQKT